MVVVSFISILHVPHIGHAGTRVRTQFDVQWPSYPSILEEARAPRHIHLDTDTRVEQGRCYCLIFFFFGPLLPYPFDQSLLYGCYLIISINIMAYLKFSFENNSKPNKLFIKKTKRKKKRVFFW